MRLPLSAVTAFLLAAQPLAAQAIPFSQHGEVRQRVGITDVTVEYNRPIARERQLFPGVVAWGRIWNPGADSATRITFSRDVRVGGTSLSAGSYSLWLIPRETGSWTMILNRQAAVFHTPYPGIESDALRLEVTPTARDEIDTLTISFPYVRPDHADLRIQWGTTAVQVRIDAPLPGA